MYLDVTVIIPNINSEDVISECIDSLDNLNVPVFIIDNGSNDKSLKIISQKKNNIKIFKMDKNLGWGNAANFGISQCKTKYAMVINPDVKFITKKPIYKFYILAEENKNLAMGTCLTIDENNIPDNGRITMFSKILKKNLNICNITPSGNTCSINNCVFGGAIIFFNIKKFLSVDGFDKNCFLYLEEDDLCLRLNKKKYINIIFPEIIAKHLGSKSAKLPNLTWWKNWHWSWSKLYFSRKYLHKKIIFFFYLKIFIKIIRHGLKTFYYLFLNKKKYFIYSGKFNGELSFLLNKPAMDHVPSAVKNNAKGLFGEIKESENENFTLNK